MDDQDRDQQGRSSNPYGRRRDSRPEPSSRDSVRRRPDYDDVVPDDRGTRSSKSSRPPDSVESESRSRSRSRYEDDVTPPRRERYSDRFRSQPRYEDEEPEPRSYRSSRDPYDRLRRVGNRPPRRVQSELDIEYGDEGYEEVDLDAVAPAGRVRRPATRREVPGVPQQRLREMSAIFANPSPELRPIVMGGIAAFVSLLLMSIVILVRSGSITDYIPLHLDAEGTTTLFGTKGSIWRLPFFALLSTVMALGLGWWLRTRDAYAVQFLVVGTLMVHCLIWVGAINLLW
jgi:hypothetical protein